MGLLDAIFPDNDASGLLGFLKRNADLAPTQGLPSDQAQYDAHAAAPLAAAPPQNFNAPSPLDNARWPVGPIGAPANANAQMPAAPAVPQNPPPVITAPAAPSPSSGIGDHFMAAYQNMRHGGGLIGSIAAGITGQRNDDQAVAQQQQAQVSNLTARALIAKGIDPQTAIAAVQPGNGEMLKELVGQTFGAPKAPTVLGNGYIWNPKTGKTERAYEPDDKIPVGFEKTDKGLRPIPGGPADPAYLRSKTQGETDPNAVKVLGKGGELYKVGPDGQPVIVHKNEDGADATLDDATTKAMAAQYLAGDRTVMQNLGRGAQGSANIVKLRTEIYKQASAAGLDGKGIVDNFNEQAGALAGQRTVGTRAANISLAANEANNMIPIAVEASKAVPRGQYVPWNKAVQAVQTGSSSPELARFVAATNSLVNAYVRAVSPSGVPTDSMREHAYSMLNSAQSHDAYVAVTKIMQDEMKAALTAPGQVQKELRREKSGEGEGGATAPKAGAYTWTPDGGLNAK